MPVQRTVPMCQRTTIGTTPKCRHDRSDRTLGTGGRSTRVRSNGPGRVDVVFDPAVTRAGAPAYKHVTLWRPTFTFATGVEGSDNQLQFDESWLDTISAIPFPTRLGYGAHAGWIVALAANWVLLGLVRN